MIIFQVNEYPSSERNPARNVQKTNECGQEKAGGFRSKKNIKNKNQANDINNQLL